MTTLIVEIQNEALVESVKILMSSLKGVKIKENNNFSQAGLDLIDGLKELKSYQKGEKDLPNVNDLLKSL